MVYHDDNKVLVANQLPQERIMMSLVPKNLKSFLVVKHYDGTRAPPNTLTSLSPYFYIELQNGPLYEPFFL